MAGLERLMKPPILAEMLIAATVPQADYASVAGDLHEEFIRRARDGDVPSANRWYWAQAVRSLPSFLSYSRAPRSLIRSIGIAFTVIVLLVAMLLATIPINALLGVIFGSLLRCPPFVAVAAYWMDAVVFGALLALVVRGASVRLAFFGSVFLVLCYAIPALSGFPASQAPLAGWVLLCSVIPAMCGGAGVGQVLLTARMR